MKYTANILNMVFLMKGAFKVAFIRKLVSKIIGLVILAIISGGILASLIVYFLYILNNLLLETGYEPQAALLLTGGATLSLAAVFLIIIYSAIRKIGLLLENRFSPESDTLKIVNSFIDGFLKK